MNEKKKSRIWLAIVGVLSTIAIGVSIGTNVRVDKSETTKVLTASSFSIGLFDDETGKTPEEADKRGLATTKYYELDGLKIEVKKNATVKYQVNYYDKDKNFLAVQTLTADFDSANIPSAATNAKYVRIEIIPLEDDDDTVSLFEKNGYADQLEITVAK